MGQAADGRRGGKSPNEDYVVLFRSGGLVSGTPIQHVANPPEILRQRTPHQRSSGGTPSRNARNEEGATESVTRQRDHLPAVPWLKVHVCDGQIDTGVP
jgi:hypothetical protein